MGIEFLAQLAKLALKPARSAAPPAMPQPRSTAADHDAND
jgi:hypothetical protein